MRIAPRAPLALPCSRKPLKAITTSDVADCSIGACAGLLQGLVAGGVGGGWVGAGGHTGAALVCTCQRWAPADLCRTTRSAALSAVRAFPSAYHPNQPARPPTRRHRRQQARPPGCWPGASSPSCTRSRLGSPSSPARAPTSLCSSPSGIGGCWVE